MFNIKNSKILFFIVLVVVVQWLSCLTLCDPTNCSTPGFPALHYFLELAQTHVHLVSDGIESFHHLFPPSFAFTLSQHQGLFQWVDSASGGQNTGLSVLVSVLSMNIQSWFPLVLTGLSSLLSKGFSRVFSSTTT